MEAILKARGIFKSFQGNPALQDVQLSLYPGEVHALMGENGAGKSTLIKVITGIHPKDAGSIELSGSVVEVNSNHEAQKLGISTVYQEVNLIPTLSIAENIYLGREPRKFGLIDWKAMREGARKALAHLDLDIDVCADLDEFPIAIQQMTAIARALDMSAKVLILDEATSSLDRQEVEQLFKILRRLKAEGISILFVSHFLDQVYEISDRVTVLRNGCFICEKKIEEISRTELIAKMMGHELLVLEQQPKVDLPETNTAPWFRCVNTGRSGSIEPFNLELKEGETLGLSGLLGSGRTEIARMLFGLDPATTGAIEINGESFHFKTPREAIAQGLALCPEDRKGQAIFPGLSVRQNAIMALQAKLGWFKFLNIKKQNEIVDHYVKALGIKIHDADQPIETLSGGNQQKVVLARWLALEPRLLILDEPTRGIDVGAKAEIQKYTLKLAQNKKSILFISSELDEMVRNCDRVAILRDRQKISELKHSEISETAIISAIGALQ